VYFYLVQMRISTDVPPVGFCYADMGYSDAFTKGSATGDF